MAVLRDTESGEELARSSAGWADAAAPLVGDHFLTLSGDGKKLQGYRKGVTEPVWVKEYKMGGAQFCLSRNGTRALVQFSNRVEILDGMSGKVLKTIVTEQIVGSGFIASTSEFWFTHDNEIEFYDGRSLQRHAVMRAEGAYIFRLDRSPDGRRIVTADLQGGLSIWDAKSHQRLCRIQVGSGFVPSIVFTADGKKILVAENDESVTILESRDVDSAIRISVPKSTEVRN